MPDQSDEDPRDPSDLDEDVEDLADPVRRYLEDDSVADVPFSPMGVVPEGVGYVGEMPPVPPANLASMICLRDCMHYFEQVVSYGAGNPRGSLDHEPEEKTRFCLLNNLDLVDETVYECNRWEPAVDVPLQSIGVLATFAARQARRDEWLKVNGDRLKVDKELVAKWREETKVKRKPSTEPMPWPSSPEPPAPSAPAPEPKPEPPKEA